MLQHYACFLTLLYCASAHEQPNILLILADDLGWNDVGYHNREVKTPSIDSLAKDGIKLESAYGLTLCSPSRSALLSGRYPFKIGMQHLVILPGSKGRACLPAQVRTLPEELKDLGYITSLVGKWHQGECSISCLPSNRGFDHFVGYYGSHVDHYHRTRNYTTGSMMHDFWNGTEVLKVDSEVHTEDIILKEAMRLLTEYSSQDKPFFMMYSSPLVHDPLQVPDEYLELYSTDIEKDRRIFLGMLSYLDNSVEKLIEALKRLGLYEDTIVIFSSDNGGQSSDMAVPDTGQSVGNNYPLRGGKIMTTEGGVRIPAFVHSAMMDEKKRGTVNKGLIHLVDWFPTLLKMAGSSADNESLDGVDQSDMIFGTGESQRDEVVIAILDLTRGRPVYSNSTMAIRQGQYKLLLGPTHIRKGSISDITEWPQPAEWKVAGKVMPELEAIGRKCGTNPKDTTSVCLYDLDADPSETKDISSEHPEIVKALTERLNFHQQYIKAPGFDWPPMSRSYEDIIDGEGNQKLGYCDEPANIHNEL